MGLITKTVMVKWYGRNKKYYEEKGYKFTKWNDMFECKVEDLSSGSNIKVQIKCYEKNCPKIWTVYYYDYIRHSHKGKPYCKSCMRILNNKNKIKLKQAISFYDWCYENLNKKEADDIMSRWNYEKNNCSPKEASYNSIGFNGKGYYFKCNKHSEHKSELHNIKGFVSSFKQYGKSDALICKQCNSITGYLIDSYGNNALEKYWDYKKNKDINPWEITKSCNKQVWVKCQKHDYHDSYFIECAHFTRGVRCPYCNSKGIKVHPKDSLGQLLKDKGLLYVWSDKNKKTAFEYTPKSMKKVWWKCFEKKHKDYYRQISTSNFCDFRCPNCVQENTESNIQEKVRLYLESLNIGQVLHEYKCTIIPINPKTKQKLPFDNELIINNKIHLIIEVNGVQHYKITNFHNLAAKKAHTTPEYELHMQQVRDRYKRIYAKSKGYYYLAIPYWNIQDNENYKELINNKINKILKERK